MLTSQAVGKVVTRDHPGEVARTSANRLLRPALVTAAMQMLGAGASLPEIGQLLRHRRALTTAIYAKVDRGTLRAIARPWPGDAA